MSSGRWMLAAFALVIAGAATVAGQSTSAVGLPPTRTQSIDLRTGWNAVFLEVEPVDTDPAAVFAGLPVDKVATFFAAKASAQFVTDPGIDLFRRLGWAVWYADGRPDAFLSTLALVYGRRAYLVHCAGDCQWEIDGYALPQETVWREGQFNFVGFPVVDPGGPSYAEFFAGAKGLGLDRIFRLVDGAWENLAAPAATPMRSGEAFWIFCDGPCDYQGPLRVETRFRTGLVLADGAEDALVLRNALADPLDVTLEHVAATSVPVPLAVSVKVVGAPDGPVLTGAVVKPGSDWSESFQLGAGAALSLPFYARGAEMSAPIHRSLLRVRTGIGTEAWIPVFGIRSDLVPTD